MAFLQESTLPWGGLIEKYLALRKEEDTDPRIEALLVILRDIEHAPDFNTFLCAFTLLTLKDVSFLNSPLVDCFYQDFYGIPVPDPSLPEEKLPRHLDLMVKGVCANSFEEMLLRETKSVPAVKYLWKRITKTGCSWNDYSRRLKIEALMRASVEVFRHYHSTEFFRDMSDCLMQATSGLNYAVIEVLPDELINEGDKHPSLRYACIKKSLPLLKSLFKRFPEQQHDPNLYAAMEVLAASNLKYGVIDSMNILEYLLSLLTLPDPRKIRDVLIHCVKGDNLHLIQLLQERGWLERDDYWRLLGTAVRNKSQTVAEYLLDLGADPLVDPNLFFDSIFHGFPIKIVKRLLLLGCNPELDGHKALKQAVHSQRQDVVELLIEWYRAHPLGFGVNFVIHPKQKEE